MRTFLLWMSRNSWLEERLPRLPFVRRAVRRFMPGEDVEAALAAASELAAAGQGILLTHLGENVNSSAEAGEVAEGYLTILERWPATRRPVELSVKPTQLGLDVDEEACLRLYDELAERAGLAGSWLWIDMESSAYVEQTVALYERLRSRHRSVGVCLQAYLKRTPSDLQRLLPLEPAVRLVKGAYDEPASLAWRRKAEVDGAFQAAALVLAEAARDGRARLALGTHDTALVERIAAFTDAVGVPRERLEVHMLYGIRTAELRRLHAAGFPASTLIAYGTHWYRWYMRRLAERPANVAFALRQILP
jgi:proline dehydrogenase